VLPILRTARSDEDLIAIWMHITKEDPGTADRVLDAIAQRWEQLAGHPLSGMARDDIAPGLRHLITGQYMTLYRIRDEGIEILRVIHGRRKIDRDSANHEASDAHGLCFGPLVAVPRQACFSVRAGVMVLFEVTASC
jgi:toxin ParE1/3/4